MATITDPIADMLTRIRNGLTAKHKTVVVPESKIKVAIAEILVKEGYITSYTVEANPALGEGEAKPELQGTITVTLKYAPEKGKKVITGLKRVSKPGLRVYADAQSIPSVLNGLGIAILSTPKGILTDKQAKLANVGGEVLAYVW